MEGSDSTSSRPNGIIQSVERSKVSKGKFNFTL